MIPKPIYKLNQNGVQIITMFEGEGKHHLLSYNAGDDVVFEAELYDVPDELLDKITFQDVIDLQEEDDEEEE